VSDRYTSTDLSRLLAEAGLPEPKEFDTVRCDADECRRLCGAGEVHELNEADCVDPCYRALDLTDVLHEIEARGATWLVETDHGTYCMTAVLNPTFSAVMGGPSAVEAAGLCLLALMDKLREAKP